MTKIGKYRDPIESIGSNPSDRIHRIESIGWKLKGSLEFFLIFVL
jgi:hypothetical protein